MTEPNTERLRGQIFDLLTAAGYSEIDALENSATAVGKAVEQHQPTEDDAAFAPGATLTQRGALVRKIGIIAAHALAEKHGFRNAYDLEGGTDKQAQATGANKTSSNPFRKGPGFNAKKCVELLNNPKTRGWALELQRSATK